MVILLIVIAIFYGGSLHLFKNEINYWLDKYSPKWYPECIWCRGIHFGFVLGVLIAMIIDYL